MIDLSSEELIPIKMVPSLPCMPKRRLGRRLSLTTVWRWAMHGRDGAKLETVKVGAQRCTTIAALDRFFKESAERPQLSVAHASCTTRRAKRSKAVEQELSHLGL